MYAASRTASLYLDKKPKTNCCITNHNHFKNKTEKLKFEFHRFHVSWCPKTMQKLKRKLSLPQLQKLSVSMYRSMCTSENHSQKLKFQNALTCPVNTVASNNVPRRKRQRQTKEPRQKRTGNHHGKQKNQDPADRQKGQQQYAKSKSIHPQMTEQSLVKLKEGTKTFS